MVINIYFSFFMVRGKGEKILSVYENRYGKG